MKRKYSRKKQTSRASTSKQSVNTTTALDTPRYSKIPLPLIRVENNPFPPPIKTAKFKYSIVSAVYNIAHYLDAYFESIINQTVDFSESIEIILVDDGSVDNSSEVIKKWAARYPLNIRYLYQKNAGQGAARNLGLRYAKNEWVSFIDADDFIAYDYFEKIDESIFKAAPKTPLKLISANYIFYYEDTDTVSDTHPLRFRFAKGDCILPATDLGKHIILNVNCVLFKRTRLIEHDIKFNHEIKPGFEDSHFVNKYLIGLDDGFVAFLKEPQYFYRKREDGSSTLDTAWDHPGRYNQQLRLGVLEIIEDCIRKYGHVKEFIQRTALYDISWHFKRLVNNENKLFFLNSEQKENYKNSIKEVMSHISKETIVSFELAGIWFYQKLGLLSLYKSTQPDFTIIYIDGFDNVKDMVKLRYFNANPKCSERFSWDNKPTIPIYSTVMRHNFLDETFIYERIVWLRIGDVKHLNITISNLSTRISLRGKQHHKGVSVLDIRTAFENSLVENDTFPQEAVDLRNKSRTNETVLKYGNCWLLMDRNTQADDNAEHLYRYIQKNQHNTRAFFVLNDTSPDWKRLKNDGFQLIPFGSEEHRLALLNASHLISSHADHYVFGGLEKKWFGDLLKYRFTFLQHGIIKDDLSNWLNSKPIDCFITSTHAEFQSIAGEGPYKFTQKDVVLAGLARHDNLKDISGETDNIILITPTWRSNLVGASTGTGNEREFNQNFSKTLYAESWRGILHSDELKRLSEIYGYQIVFFPHANIQPYISTFETPDYITIKSHTAGESIQALLSRASIVVTDYSSIVFDVATLDRAVVYFQFDSHETFNGGHIYRPGYFDYHKDGFGPVCENPDEVIRSLEEILNNEGRPNAHYLKRMRDTFAFDDTNSCQRTYKAIDKLEQSTVTIENSRPAAIEYARRAMLQSDWQEALLAWTQAKPEGTQYAAEAAFDCAIACRKLDLLTEATEWLKIAETAGYDSSKIQEERLIAAIEASDLININQLCCNFKYENTDIFFEDSTLALLIRAHRLQNDITKAKFLLDRVKDLDQPEILKERAHIASHYEMWPEAYELWRTTVLRNNKGDDHSLLRFAQACRHMKLFPEANKILTRIKSGDNLPGFHHETAEISFLNEQWKVAESAWTQISNNEILPPDSWLKLSRARRKIGDLHGASKAFSEAGSAKDERTFLQEKALLLNALGRYPEAVQAWELFLSRKDLSPNRDAWLHLANARLQSGDLNQSKKDVEKFESFSGPTKKSAQLNCAIEIALKA